jgi:hypothetical protein
MKGKTTIVYEVQRYICLIVSLYLLCCLAHDIWVYRGMQLEEIREIRKQEELAEEMLRRLDALIQLIEEKALDDETKKRLVDLRERFNERPEGPDF